RRRDAPARRPFSSRTKHLSRMTVVRSVLFNTLFYLVTAAMLIATLPIFFFLSRRNAMRVVRDWASTCVWLYRWCGATCVNVRGADHIPTGAAIVASKHQSSFETFALIPLLPDPTIVMKRVIRWFPI